MARGINKTTDRKSVRDKTITVRFNDYELESIAKHLQDSGSNKRASVLIRDLVLAYLKEDKPS
jgi:hypothetical protein